MCVIKLVCAFDNNYGIGVNGKLPWPPLKDDMLHFKNITTDNGKNGVLMGRKTFESIPRKHFPLPNRTNIVLSKTLGKLDTPGITVIRDIREILNFDLECIFIIGGNEIYKTALELLDIKELYLTKIDFNFACDTDTPVRHNILRKLNTPRFNTLASHFTSIIS